MALVSLKSPSGRLELRSPELSNAPNILARVSDPACVAHLPHLRNREFTLEGINQRIERWRASSSVTDLFLVVISVADGKVIGDGGYEVIDQESKTGEVGVMLNSDESVRGKGYAVEALGTMCDYGFGALGLERVRLRTLKVNAPMRTLLERKFSLTAESREVEAGTECLYTVSRQDWLERRQRSERNDESKKRL